MRPHQQFLPGHKALSADRSNDHKTSFALHFRPTPPPTALKNPAEPTQRPETTLQECKSGSSNLRTEYPHLESNAQPP